MLSWLTCEWTLRLFSFDSTKARKAYAAFVNEGLAEGRRPEFHSGSCDGRILGDDRFADDVLHRANENLPPARIPDVLQAVSTLYGLTPEDLRAPGKFRPASEARALAALLVRETPTLSLSELGRHLNRDVAALSQAARRLGMQIRENSDLAARRNALQKMLEKV